MKIDKTIIIALIGAIASIVTAFFGYLSVTHSGKESGQEAHTVPLYPNEKIVDNFPVVTNASNYTVLRGVTVFDLRAWKPFEGIDRKKERTQPVYCIDYLTIIKTKECDKYVSHFATIGFGIDLRCVTHNFEILKREGTARHHDEDGWIEYQVEIDISRMPLNKEFLVIVEGTYWNGFINNSSESASTYTRDDVDNLQEIALIIIFPTKKPFKSYELLTRGDNDKDTIYRGPINSLYTDKDKQLIYWNIGEREKNRHYTIKWDW